MPSAPLVRPHCHDHDPGSATASSKAKHRLSSDAGIQKNHRQQHGKIILKNQESTSMLQILKSVMNMLKCPLRLRCSWAEPPYCKHKTSLISQHSVAPRAQMNVSVFDHCSRSSECSLHVEDLMISIRFFQHLPASSTGFLSTWTIQLPPVESKMALRRSNQWTQKKWFENMSLQKGVKDVRSYFIFQTL